MLDHLPQPSLNPASVAAVEARAAVCTIGIISAFTCDATPDENASRDANLRVDARQSGLGRVRLHGRHSAPTAVDPVDEWAVLAFSSAEDNGRMKGFLRKHGQKYDQQAVFYKPCGAEDGFLIGTRTDGFLAVREVFNLGKWNAAQIPQIHSILRGHYGRPTIRFETYRIVNQLSFFSRRESEFT